MKELPKDFSIEMFTVEKSPSIGFLGYNEKYKILGVVYENAYNKITFFLDVDKKHWDKLKNPLERHGVYIFNNIKDSHEKIVTSRNLYFKDYR